MPSLDDLGTKQVITGTPASGDYMPFYDVSEFGNDKIKKTLVSDLVGGAHTHVSADITDLSFGGNANLDGNKAVKFGTIGEIYASYAVRIVDPGSGYIQLEHLTSPTSGHAAKFPDKAGAVCILPIYVDSAAANAVVSVGDAWWDLTLNKARVRLV